MNKESFNKNRFWYLLGGFGLVFAIMALFALFGMAGASEKVEKDIASKKKDLTNKLGAATPMKNERFIQPWNAYKEIFAKQKDNVWNDAWATQQNLFVWPAMQGQLAKKMEYPADLKKATDDAKKVTLEERREYRDIYYSLLFNDLKKIVAPAIFKGDNVGFETMMRPALAAPVTGTGPGAVRAAAPVATGPVALNKLFEKDLPNAEEIWIAQEDFWLKREMLNIVRYAQQRVGICEPVAVKKEDFPGFQQVYRFKNGLWEITLLVKKEGGAAIISKDSTIKNISPTRTILPLAGSKGRGLLFQLSQGSTGAHYELEIAGLPVAYEETRKIDKDHPSATVDFAKPFKMEQDFDWINAPVRRIDSLIVGKHSHRTAKKVLEANPAFKPDPPAATTGAPAAPAVPAPANSAAASAAAAAAAAAALEPTPNGLERCRYIMATDQVRHIPIAMVLVVEQAHINDVLIAIANSPFRIQTTQVAFQHVTIKGPVEPAEPGKPPTIKTTVVPGQPAAPGTSDDPNLVELSIYAIATLYERPKKAETPPAPAKPAK